MSRLLSPRPSCLGKDTMAVVALSLFILWIFSLWLLVAEQRRPHNLRLFAPLAITSGALLFCMLSIASLLFLRLLFTQ